MEGFAYVATNCGIRRDNKKIENDAQSEDFLVTLEKTAGFSLLCLAGEIVGFLSVCVCVCVSVLRARFVGRGWKNDNNDSRT